MKSNHEYYCGDLYKRFRASEGDMLDMLHLWFLVYIPPTLLI